jgi:hypothetical protein
MILSSFLSNFLRRRANNTAVDAQLGGGVLRVVSIDVLAGRTAVVCEDVTGLATFLVAAVPTERQAQQWRRLLRVDHVELEIAGPNVRTAIHGVGHRLPMRREVPVSVALSLLNEGIAGRVFVEGSRVSTSAYTVGEWREVKCQRLTSNPTTTE